jgi:hypothetical protein
VPLIPWATLDDLPADRPVLPGGDEQWTLLLAASSEVLYALTGRRHAGLRERAVELYAPAAAAGSASDRPSPPPGSTTPSAAAQCWGRPGMTRMRCPPAVWGSCRPHEVRLPNRNVAALVVVADAAGAPLDVSRYRIARGGYLRRAPHTDAEEAPLPGCRRPLRLRYRFGTDPGPAGRAHATTLALALGQAVTDPDSSPLPGSVTQIARQGVTFTQQAASVLIGQGMTGLPGVDMWIGSANPGRLRRPGGSWSPDTDAPYYPLPIEEVPS